MGWVQSIILTMTLTLGVANEPPLSVPGKVQLATCAGDLVKALRCPDIDYSRQFILQGVVVRADWSNVDDVYQIRIEKAQPHGSTGGVWVVRAPANYLLRHGFSRDRGMVGRKVTVKAYPFRNETCAKGCKGQIAEIQATCHYALGFGSGGAAGTPIEICSDLDTRPAEWGS
jgi:hypothetical protein